MKALKARFPGVNASVLGRVADMLAKTARTEEEATTAAEGVSQDLLNLIEAYGDSRATEATQTAVGNYERISVESLDNKTV